VRELIDMSGREITTPSEFIQELQQCLRNYRVGECNEFGCLCLGDTFRYLYDHFADHAALGSLIKEVGNHMGRMIQANVDGEHESSEKYKSKAVAGALKLEQLLGKYAIE
jgi:hypothetical protein